MTLPTTTPPDGPLTFEEYLRFERTSGVRHEFVRGEVYAMSGASGRHNRILSNVSSGIWSAVRTGTCEMYRETTKLRVAGDVYYPDVMVVCEPHDPDALIMENPCLVIEVTSAGTRRADHVEKLHVYRGIASLRTYLLIEQTSRRVDRHWREDAGAWRHETLIGDSAVALPCPPIELTFDEIYRGITFPVVRERQPAGYAPDTDDSTDEDADW